MLVVVTILMMMPSSPDSAGGCPGAAANCWYALIVGSDWEHEDDAGTGY